MVSEEKQPIWKKFFQKLLPKYEREYGECFAIMKMTDEEADEFDAFLEQIQESDFWKKMTWAQQTEYLRCIPKLFEEYKKK